MPQHAKTWLRISGSVIAGKWRIRMGFAQGAREGANLVIAPTAATAAPTPLSHATFPARSAYPSPQALPPPAAAPQAACAQRPTATASSITDYDRRPLDYQHE
jgi:hypothetical protein